MPKTFHLILPNATGHDFSVFPTRCDFSLDYLIITFTSVAKAISNLDPSTASGPDNILVIVLQKCSPELSAFFSKLFNNYLTPECILHLYKSLICPSMEYRCHIWAGDFSVELSLLDKVQRRIVNIIGPTLAENLQPLSQRHNVASISLFYKYFNGRRFSELSSLVPPVKTPVLMTRLSKNSHPYPVTIPFCKKGFYSSSFFLRNGISFLRLAFPIPIIFSPMSSANCFLLRSLPV